jgi:hypothetical protein
LSCQLDRRTLYVISAQAASFLAGPLMHPFDLRVAVLWPALLLLAFYVDSG